MNVTGRFETLIVTYHTHMEEDSSSLSILLQIVECVSVKVWGELEGLESPLTVAGKLETFLLLLGATASRHPGSDWPAADRQPIRGQCGVQALPLMFYPPSPPFLIDHCRPKGVDSPRVNAMCVCCVPHDDDTREKPREARPKRLLQWRTVHVKFERKREPRFRIPVLYLQNKVASINDTCSFVHGRNWTFVFRSALNDISGCLS